MPRDIRVLPLTEPQLKAIYAVGLSAAQMDDDELDADCTARFGVPPEWLNRRQAAAYIDALKVGSWSVADLEAADA
jgi:hypothetical protein